MRMIATRTAMQGMSIGFMAMRIVPGILLRRSIGMLAAMTVRRMIVMRGFFIRRLMMAMDRVLDMLGSSPTRLAEEGQEHQTPTIEAGEQRRENTHQERPGAIAASGEGRLKDRVL